MQFGKAKGKNHHFLAKAKGFDISSIFSLENFPFLQRISLDNQPQHIQNLKKSPSLS